ncbi:MAG: 3-isopropylmalate dehydrogenase [Sporomusaceae bacterium]|jgi:3-isopropylmalate dehydrogenase|nr:3-isopropylmalate dehydrogenase [Sporomusaceae bacterium]
MAQITVIPGDGIGKEITAAALRVLEAVAARDNFTLTHATHLAGGAAIDATGEPLPQKTIAACKKSDAVLLGAVGGPKWDNVPPALRAEKAILGLRKELGLYANLRPIKVFAPLAQESPLKDHLMQGVDILIVRELTGGIYFGPKEEAHEKDGSLVATDLEIYHSHEIKRILEVAFTAAKGRRQKVTSVDKANVLATSRLWRKIASEMAANEKDLTVEHMYVDNCAMQLILAPAKLDVVVTSNLFGDILSDEAAVIAGSIGLLPSASLGSGSGLYEPIHGSAPDIEGLGIANPLGTILSAAMLLRHSLKKEAAAAAIEKAVEATLASGYRTADLYRAGFTKVSTEEMGKLVIENLGA